MKLVKAHENTELLKGQGSPRKVNEPRIPKRKTKGTQEPMSKKKPVAIPSHWGKE